MEPTSPAIAIVCVAILVAYILFCLVDAIWFNGVRRKESHDE